MHKFSFHRPMVISAALLYGNSVEAIQNWVFALGPWSRAMVCCSKL